MTVTVIGAGSWGTALALLLLRNGHRVRLLGREPETLADLATLRENRRYLPGFVLPGELTAGPIDGADRGAEMTVIAVPSAAVAEVAPAACESEVVVVASKGLAGGRLLSETVRDACPGTRVVVLSGPNLALEIARGVPTLAVVAESGANGHDSEAAVLARDAFMTSSYRVYLGSDALGIELAGSLKNVYAIAAGMSDGLGFGDNTKGALLARGLNEMARLGLAMGARLETFMGIAGVGDLFATANSRLSRNYRVGWALGQGQGLEDALEQIGQVAEGVATTEQALALAAAHRVDVPIMEVVRGVIAGHTDARKAVTSLMERTPKREAVLEAVP